MLERQPSSIYSVSCALFRVFIFFKPGSDRLVVAGGQFKYLLRAFTPEGATCFAFVQVQLTDERIVVGRITYSRDTGVIFRPCTKESWASDVDIFDTFKKRRVSSNSLVEWVQVYNNKVYFAFTLSLRRMLS